MYNIIEQTKYVNMSVANTNSSATNGVVKVDCAKECPCGVPVIPVPDQWLEVMVTGGFKVWHIIFILIAFVVTIVVVYCCFHRCRIPRTKQEIEADLMRTNLAGKFREYLQEFPNEPTTFMDALKRVQELEEKSSEQDDASARKRKGWLKLKGKDKQAEKSDGTKEGQEKEVDEVGVAGEEKQPPNADNNNKQATGDNDAKTALEGPDKQPNGDATRAADSKTASEALATGLAQPLAAGLQPLDFNALKTAFDIKDDDDADADDAKMKKPNEAVRGKSAAKDKKTTKGKEAKLVKTKGEKVRDEGEPSANQLVKNGADKKPASASGKTSPSREAVAPATIIKPAKARRRRDKPNLARTKGAGANSRAESPEAPPHNQLTLPAPTHHQHKHHQPHHHHSDKQSEEPKPGTSGQVQVEADEEKQVKAEPALRGRKTTKTSKAKPTTSRGAKTRSTKDSTIIQIEPTTEVETPKP